MPLSIEGLPEVEAVCKAHNFKCTFVYDPYQSIDTLDPELLPYAQSQDLSDELIEKGILNHFPGIAVLEDGQILGNIHLGYLEPETLEWVILRRLQ